MSHDVTVVWSGSWKQTISGGRGDREYGDAYALEQEMFIEAECTCGGTFRAYESVYEHLNEVHDGE